MSGRVWPVCRRKRCGTSLEGMRVDAAWCSRSCYLRCRRGESAYISPTELARRPTRDGVGVRLYISEDEARALAQGTVPARVAEKCATKLATPAPPIAGQMDILTALAESAVKEVKP